MINNNLNQKSKKIKDKVNNLKITKAVIPVAGLGTRFLPFTKTVPKEMLPILNFPSIHYIVQDAVNAGITDIIFITSSKKTALVDYTDSDSNLEDKLRKQGKQREIDLINLLPQIANYVFVRQSEQLGLGHAVLQAKKALHDKPFALLLGDDVIISDYINQEKNSAIKELLEAFNKYHAPILGVQEVEDQYIEKYGIIGYKQKLNNRDFKVDNLIEKPKLKDAPSNLAILGRYILTNDIFKYLESEPIDQKTGEIQLTNAINRYLQDQNDVYAHIFKGKRYDMGSILGFLEAQIDFSLHDKSLKSQVLEIFKKHLKNNLK